ncbi:MAG TPA: AAA family ATPase, partial [Burkholderiales bacterium]|nr:AAA family ATPase [Burkholderiales bacterium]
MTSGTPQLAKLSRPRLYEAMPRERLFRLLDKKRAHPVILVSGQPGAGKTTLVASYIETRGIDSLWFQMDDGDRDVTTFFFYLNRACNSLSGARAPALNVSPEQMHDLRGFARQYFRRFFEGLTKGTLLVLDNLQEIDDAPDLQTVIGQMMLEVPLGISVCLITRTDLPRGFSPHIASQRVTSIDWSILRFTDEEAHALASYKDSGPLFIDQAVFSKLDGWAAGLVLMREQARAVGTERGSLVESSPTAVFDYFAAEIFDRQDAKTRQVLLSTAYLPYFTADMAEQVSEQTDAGAIVDGLYRRHLFVNQRPDKSYELHALFREFLRSRALDHFGLEDLSLLRRRAAKLLLVSGDPDSGFGLFVGATDWASARRLVLDHADRMLKQGRWQTLEKWLSALRGEDFDAEPWLIYWRGMTELAVDAPKSRSIFEAAYEKFSASRNRTGTFMSVAQILRGYFLAWDAVVTLDPWISVMEGLIADSAPVTDEALHLAYGAMLVALLYRKPTHSLLPVCAKWVADNLEVQDDPTQRLELTTCLLHYYDLMGYFDRCQPLIENKKNGLLTNPEIAPSARMMGWIRYACHFEMSGGDRDAAIDGADRAIALGQEEGLPDSLLAFALDLRAHMLNAFGEWQGALEDLERGRRILPHSQLVIVIHFYWAQFWSVVLSGDMARAAELWKAFGTLPMAGVPFNTAYNQSAVFFLCESGKSADALERVTKWHAALEGMKSPFLNFNLLLMKSFVLLRRECFDEARDSLAQALTIGAARRFSTTLGWVPQLMAPLLGFALENSVERRYVCHLIRCRDLAPMDSGNADWPYPVKVKALGGFEVAIEDEPVRFTKRPQHRTLALLKAIAAFGGENVSVVKVIAAL